MKLKKCPVCNIYTLEERCPRCEGKLLEAHYKFIKIRSQDQSDSEISQ